MGLPDFYVLQFLIFMLHVITGSLTFKILAGISALFYFCIITLLALGIILCFYCLFMTFEYHFLGWFSRESSHICIKTFSLTYFFARTPNIFLLKAYTLIKNILFYSQVILMLVISSGSVKTNPGPNTNSQNRLSFAMWNLDSLPSRDYSRIPVVESLQAVHNFDIFAVCKSSLNELIPDESVSIHGFTPASFRADKCLTAHNGAVCLYFKESLPIKR